MRRPRPPCSPAHGDTPVVVATRFYASHNASPLTPASTEEQRADIAKFDREIQTGSPATHVVIPEAFRTYPV